MNKHASLNRIDRLVWKEALNAYVSAAETARGCFKRSTRSLVATVLAHSATVAQAGPDTVDFVQPNTSAIAVNRILSASASSILGPHRWTAKSYLAARIGSQSSLIHDPASARLWVELAKEF